MRQITISFTYVTFCLGVMSRSLIVRHAEGFVHQGKLNVALAHQLYWLGWAFYNAFILIVFPITPLLTKDNMSKSKVVRTCMFTTLGEEEESHKNQTTSFLVNIVGGFVQLFYTTFFTLRVNNYKAKYFLYLVTRT